MDYIEEIMKWNEIAGNENTFDYTLESSMLAEEMSEAIIAMKTGDDIELVDGIIDSFIVGIGALYKKGYNAGQINHCFAEIIRSNNSKFYNGKAEKNDSGKIVKPHSFSPANLAQFIGNRND